MKILELFSGYGTATFALKALGIKYELVGYSDIDKYANQCFKQNHCPGDIDDKLRLGDATMIDPHELEDFDLLTGGFPCQAFSVAGKGLGELDTRGTLFNEIIRIAEVKQPRYMLLENVKGLTFKKHKPTFDKILSELDRIGYYVKWQVLNTKEHGIPQNRERVFFVCFSDFLDYNHFDFPKKEELKLFLKDILEDEVDEKYYLKEHTVKRLLNNGQGFRSKMNPEIGSYLFALMHKVARGMDMIKQVGMINQTCKKRTHETPKEINLYLRDKKEGYSIKVIANYLNIPKTQVEHYFRIDGSRAIPSPDIWLKLKQLLNFDETYDKQVTSIYEKEIEFESTRRVYSDEGCSPTISSTNADKIIQLNNPKHSNDRVYSKEGCSPTLNAMQGGDRQPFIISSTQKHNTINNKGIMNCLPSAMGMGGGHTPMVEDLKKSELTIRKLTPKECFRLQGFLNDEVNLEGLSNTQRYKLAGNGQSVNVVKKIFKEIFK